MSYLSRLAEVVQNLEAHENQVRINKLIFSVCQKKWNNDINRLIRLELSNLVEELYQRSPTLAHLKCLLYGIVIRLNKPTEYSLIADIIINEMEKLYSPNESAPQISNRDEATAYEFPSADNQKTYFPNESAPQISSRDDWAARLHPVKSTGHELQFADNQQGKLVVLKLEEDNREQGIKATLEIIEANNVIHTRVVSWLPTAQEILKQYDYWQSNYRNLDVNYRRGNPATRFTNISSISRIQSGFRAAEALKESLNKWYNSPEFTLIRDSLEQLNSSEEIKVIVRTKNNRLWQLPWQVFFESFLNGYPKAEVALSLPEPARVSQLIPKDKVKILAVLGNSPTINISAELKQLSALPDAESLLLTAPHRQEIEDKLYQQDWSILFFSSYSSSHREPGRIYINETESLTSSGLKYALRKAFFRGLKLAIFNFDEALGMTRELASLQIPQIIVMREPVPNTVAQEFLIAQRGVSHSFFSKPSRRVNLCMLRCGRHGKV